ncbi:MAG: hypothetical protein JST54_28940 [Deltaproteobacteria bacterium]|nr:hypothetical protein [Deltaproteobacteria bacterium]
MSRAFRDVTRTMVEVLDEHEVAPELVADVGEALIEVYARHLVRGRAAPRSRE